MSLKPETLTALRQAFGERLLVDEPLARHTSARIGGPADAFLAAQTLDDLRTVSRLAWAHSVPLFILGGGSNILISDAGVRGIVVHNRTSEVRFEGTTVTADSGVSTISLTRRAIKRGLAGMEWAIGVPGTLGGAVFGNAGAHGSDMAAVVTMITAVTPEGDRTFTGEELAFEYRSSRLKREARPLTILSITLALSAEASDTIQARADGFNEARKRSQPPGATIGSMFKNPPGDYAGRLIDAAGLKGTQIGGAQISEKHANFFLNAADATASDVKALVDFAREEVRKQFGVTLELEVELIGEWQAAG